jgi:hypothetical protein
MNRWPYDEENRNVVVCPDCGHTVEHDDPRIIHPCPCDWAFFL